MQDGSYSTLFIFYYYNKILFSFYFFILASYVPLVTFMQNKSFLTLFTFCSLNKIDIFYKILLSFLFLFTVSIFIPWNIKHIRGLRRVWDVMRLSLKKGLLAIVLIKEKGIYQYILQDIRHLRYGIQFSKKLGDYYRCLAWRTNYILKIDPKRDILLLYFWTY